MIILSSEIYLLSSYLITVIVSIITAKALGLPLMPEKPRIYSFTISALYPTPILAIGIFAIFKVLGYGIIYHGFILAILTGLIIAILTKYLFYYIFPKPPEEGDNQWN